MAIQAIHEQCARRGVCCCVVAIPKSIENEILIIDKAFGFDTAVEELQRPLLAAKVRTACSVSHALAGTARRLLGKPAALPRRHNELQYSNACTYIKLAS